MTAGADRTPAGDAPAGDAPVRLALILSGGASLGAYVGGVVSELLGALTRDRGGRVELAVLAGSSAGAVTAAVAARAMTVNPGLLPLLRKLWVEALDIRHLLDAGRPDLAGVFSDEAIRELSAALIAADPASDDRRAEGVADTLALGMTLSNLTGVPYRLRYRFQDAPDRECGARVYRDAISFRLSSPVRPSDPRWEGIRRAALASSALPFALPPVELERRLADYPRACFPDDAADPRRMWFADGGIFANAPIRLARHLARGFPDEAASEWRYVLVDPDLGDADDEPDPPTSLPGVAGAIVAAVLGQGAAIDWAETTETNVRLELFEALVRRLPEIAAGLLDPSAVGLGREVARLAEAVAEGEAERAGAVEEDGGFVRLAAELARIEADPRFGPAMARVETRAARTRLAKLIYVLEAAGDLRDKRVLTIHRVGPRPGERLAGGFLGNLGGFLERDWRAADFAAGRRDAARLLTRHFSGLLEYDGDPEAIEVRAPAEASYRTASPATRAEVDRFVDQEARRILDSVRADPLARLFGFIWKPAVRRWLRRWVRELLEARPQAREASVEGRATPGQRRER